METAKTILIDGELTEAILGAAIRVQSELGMGFLERVYENALSLECQRIGLEVQQQVPLSVKYRGETVGEYVADLIVSGSVLIELKATKSIDPAHIAQTLNYLKATGIQTGLLLNFGQTPLGIKRLRF